MRLIRSEFASVRRHRDLVLDFAPGVTVIGGANESGKSSLVEALHRTLFVRAASSGTAAQDLRSQLHAGHPQIKVEFETSEQHWTLLKRFSGPSGTTQLQAKGQVALFGSAAEDQLAHLLGVDEILNSRQVNKTLPSRWAHLWVKQGESGRDLLSLSDDHYDLNNLIECLEQKAEQSLQSPLDQRVHSQLERLVSESLSSRGVRQQSELWKRQEALQAAKERHTEKLEQLQDFELSCEELDRVEDKLRNLELERLPELRQQRQRLLQLQEAFQQLKPLTLQQQQLERNCATLRKLSADSTACRHNLAGLERELQALETTCNVESNQIKEAQQRSADLEQQRQALEEQGLLLRQRKDRDELQQRLEGLSRQHEERQRLTAQHQQLTAAFNSIEGGTAKDLQQLNKTQEELRAIAIRIESMASTVLVESADQTIAIDGSQLKEGESCEQAGVFHIDVGEHVRLQISPGEGTGLSSLKKTEQSLQSALKAGLKLWKANSLEEAQQRSEQRNLLLQQQALIKAQLSQLIPPTGQQGPNLEELRLQLDVLNQGLPTKELKPDSDHEKELDQCRTQYRKLKDESDTHQKTIRLLEINHADQQKQWQQKNLQQERLKAEQKQRINQHQLLEQEVGSQEQLSQLIETLTSQQRRLEVHIQDLQQPNPTPQHVDPKAELEALDRLEHQLTEQRHELGIQRGALLERCDSLGQADLHSAVAEASAKLDLATQAEQQEALLIRARSHLLQRFEQARSDLSQRYSNPLKRNINLVLQPLLANPNDGCSLSYDPKDGLQELGLQREGTLFTFNQLSGGMKEQLNAALRIAIAETLKERHGGCLPLLFDDAFTNTDAQRLKGVLEMLKLAVSKGLQIVVLSCDPEPYKSIADKVIMID